MQADARKIVVFVWICMNERVTDEFDETRAAVFTEFFDLKFIFDWAQNLFVWKQKHNSFWIFFKWASETE